MENAAKLPAGISRDVPWSRITVERVRGASRLTCHSTLPPLKVLSPGAGGGDCCHAVLSNYGGGFLQGDEVNLEVHCGARARLLLGSQANTRIYRNPEGRASVFRLHGSLGAGALGVVVPEPVVPHAESIFRQEQVWRLAADARLILAEWLIPGRLELQERFAFQRYRSEIKIFIEDELLLLERCDLEPGAEELRSPAHFGPFGSMLNVYLIGPGLDGLAQAMEATAEALAGSENPAARRVIHCLTPLKKHGQMLRLLGLRRLDTEPVIEALLAKLREGFLDFNPSDLK